MATDFRGKKLHHNDIAVVSNKINNFQLHHLSKNEIKVFWTIISQMANQSDEEILHHGIHFSFKEIAELSGFKHLTKKRLYNLIRNMFAHLAQTLLIEEKKKHTDLETTIITPLKEIKITTSDGDVLVMANEAMIPFLHKLHKTYTAFELQRLMTLSSRYSLRLYTLLMQWRSTGKVILSKKFFYEIMDVPASYKKPNRTSTIDERIILPAIQELNAKKLVTNLKCNKKYTGVGVKGGHAISQYIFTFKPQKLNSKIKHKQNGKFRKIKAEETDQSTQQFDDEKNNNYINKQDKNKGKDNEANTSSLTSLVGNIFN